MSKVIHYSYYKRVVEDFEEYMNSAIVMDELRDMNAKDVVRVIREVWEEVKSKD